MQIKTSVKSHHLLPKAGRAMVQRPQEHPLQHCLGKYVSTAVCHGERVPQKTEDQTPMLHQPHCRGNTWRNEISMLGSVLIMCHSSKWPLGRPWPCGEGRTWEIQAAHFIPRRTESCSSSQGSQETEPTEWKHIEKGFLRLAHRMWSAESKNGCFTRVVAQSTRLQVSAVQSGAAGLEDYWRATGFQWAVEFWRGHV